MSEPKRRLSISVPSLPWERKDDGAELTRWEEARKRAAINAQLRQAEQEEQRTK